MRWRGDPVRRLGDGGSPRSARGGRWFRFARRKALDRLRRDQTLVRKLPSLFELLILLAPRHAVIPERLRVVAERATGPLRALADEAYRDALEHIEVHAEEPDHC